MTRRISLVIVLVLTIAYTLVAAKGEKAAPPIRQTIEAGNKALTDALAAGDAAKAASHYAEKAQLFPPDMPMVSGRAAIQDAYTKMGKFNLQLQTAEVEQVQGTAWESGTWQMPDAHLNGKFVVIWTQTKDGWKIYRDIWNSDAPPAAPAVPAAAAPSKK